MRRPIEEEGKFREASLAADLRQSRVGILVITISLLTFTLNDYYFYGSSAEFYGLAALRIAITIFSILILLALVRVRDHQSYDRQIALWLFIIVAASLVFNSTRPENFIVHVVMVSITVFIIYLIIPQNPISQVTFATALSVGEVLIILAAAHPSAPALYSVLLSLFFANAIAALSSVQLRGYRRSNYRELTERRRADAALREAKGELEIKVEERTRALSESEARYRGLVAASSELLYRMSPDWSEMMQLHSHGFLADTERPNPNWLHEYIPEDERPRVTAAINEAIRTKSVFELEHRVNRKDGEIGWTFSRAVPMFDDEGEIVEWFGAANDITNRKTAEEAVKESQQRFHKAFESNPSAVAITRAADSRYLDVNEAWQTLFGWSREEVIGRTSRELGMFPTNYAEVKSIVGRTIKDGKTRSMEVAAYTKTGELLRVLSSTEIVNINGEDHILSSVVDLTDRKRAEEALRESEEIFRGFIDESIDGVAIISEEGKFLEWNRGMEAITGYRREETTGRYFWDVQYKLSKEEQQGRFTAEMLKEAMTEALKTGKAPFFGSSLEAQLCRKDGQIRWVQQSAFPIRTAKGYRIGTIVRDVTDERRAELALLESEKKYRSIGELVPFGIWTTDAHGQANYISPSFAELVGKSEEEVLRFGWLNALDPETVERTINDWRKTVEAGDFWNYTHRILGADGQWHYVLARGVPLKDDEGRMLGWGGVNIDITEQKMNEENLARSNEELQQFAYVASHDMQEPLRMVIAYLSLLNKKFGDELSPQAKEYMSTAVEGAWRMRQLVNDLLEYSRVETKVQDFKPIDMNQVADEVKNDLRYIIQETRAEVIVKQLPTVFGDGVQMKQLLINLVSNAIKFRGPRSPRIIISSREDWHDFTLAIEDNGIGIDPRYADKLFKMFSRLHTRDEYPGTGIGLAIAKKIVERHHGRIWFESEPGKGTSFFFTIPKKPINEGA